MMLSLITLFLKRKYRKGYYVSYRNKQTKSVATTDYNDNRIEFDATLKQSKENNQ